MTGEEMKKVLAGVTEVLDRTAQEAARSQKEFESRQKEFDKRQKELHRSQAETDRKLQDLAANIGGLNNKFGSFTEALAGPSLRKLLFEDLKMDVVDENVIRNIGRRNIQIDVLAFSNSRHNAVFVVEIKSRLREEGITQLGRILERFPDFFPEHRDKELFAMLAVVECEADIRKKVLEEGIYLAEINDNVFELEVPKEFEPRSFSHPPKPAAAGAL